MKITFKNTAITTSFWAIVLVLGSCKKTPAPVVTPPPPPAALFITGFDVNGQDVGIPEKVLYDVPAPFTVTLRFNKKVNDATLRASIIMTAYSDEIPFQFSYPANDSSKVLLTPERTVLPLFPYSVYVLTTLKASDGGVLDKRYSIALQTRIDSTDKFPVISDSSLLDLVQQQTFKYFWDFGHPVSGLARERSNGDNETVTSGGSGFGIMSIPVAIKRNFISRSEGLLRVEKIVNFLQNNAQTFHGAFPHWLNGTSGVVIPFSQKDNGADLVETSFLMAGLLTARQYFDRADATESALRTKINSLYNNVEWDWFRNGGQDVLYWHWSPNYNWDMNLPIRGWNECMITYIMAASSPTHSIPQSVYTNGFARSGGMRNGTAYYGYTLPLGSAYGGPLFLSHYSFLGVNPTGLTDQYANYETQVVNHSKINYTYCVNNPKDFFGYSSNCWGLTASDIVSGYRASSPTDDQGFIAPTAAISSMPYTPVESMKALKFFYYKLGNRLWGQYGFKDAFTLRSWSWFADSHLAIDQGPIIIMLENYRSGLVWNLLTSCPEVKTGMRSLGFSAPYL